MRQSGKRKTDTDTLTETETDKKVALKVSEKPVRKRDVVERKRQTQTH